MGAGYYFLWTLKDHQKVKSFGRWGVCGHWECVSVDGESVKPSTLRFRQASTAT